jgi:Dynamin GTPase effector domain
MELNRPFTLSDLRFKDVVDKNLTGLLQERYELLTNRDNIPMHPSSSTHTIRDERGTSHSITSRGIDTDVIVGLLAAKGFPISSAKQLARLHDHGDCHVELELIATVQAYFDFSTERICDVVSQLFENIFVRRFVARLKKSLVLDLGLVGEQGHLKCVAYARDEPRIEEERQVLKKQKDILLKAKQIISQFYQ